MKKVNQITLSIATSVLLLSSAAVQAGGIVGSPHDFSGETWNTSLSDQHTVCSVCHTPHHASTTAGPLWNHTQTSPNFTMYANGVSPGANIKFTPAAQPSASSLACLSCHDGTVAVNSYGGAPANATPVTITNSANLTKDLSHSHPISFAYDSTLVAKDKWIYDPATAVTAPAASGTPFVAASDMTINGFFLGGGKDHMLECSSCHDVHNQEGSAFDIVYNPKLVKMVGVDAKQNGSLLCRSCHNK